MTSAARPTSARAPKKLGVVIGAMRAGTTSLHQWFQQCPSVCVSRIKEPDFFISEKSAYRGAGWYAGLFSDLSQVCIDVSPNYAKNDVFPGVARAIHQFEPDARVVYVVRDPVERLISEYFHQKAAGVSLPPPEKLLKSSAGQHMLSTSRYASQIRDYYEVFPADQIRLVDMRALVSDPRTQVGQLLEFLGAPAIGPLDLQSGVSNDRASLQRLPRAWLWLRRTRAGDWIRDVVPSRLHTRLKSIGSALSPTQPAVDASFPEDVRAAIRMELAADMEALAALIAPDGFDWLAPKPAVVMSEAVTA